MCLAIPAQVVAIDGSMAVVELEGNRRTVDISLVADEAAAGRYVLVHAGIALQVLDEAEAQETLALIWGAFGNG